MYKIFVLIKQSDEFKDDTFETLIKKISIAVLSGSGTKLTEGELGVVKRMGKMLYVRVPTESGIDKMIFLQKSDDNMGAIGSKVVGIDHDDNEKDLTPHEDQIVTLTPSDLNLKRLELTKASGETITYHNNDKLSWPPEDDFDF